MYVLIESTIGGYVVSKAQSYTTSYTVDYTPYNVALNIWGQRLCDILDRDICTKTYYQTRYKAGSALSSVFKDATSAHAYIQSNGLSLYTGRLHVSV